MLGCLLQYTTNIGFNVFYFACFSRAQTANVMQLNLRLATTVELILLLFNWIAWFADYPFCAIIIYNLCFLSAGLVLLGEFFKLVTGCVICVVQK